MIVKDDKNYNLNGYYFIKMIAIIDIFLFSFLFSIVAKANVCLDRITNEIEKNTKNSPSASILIIKDKQTIYKKSLGLIDINNKSKQTTTSTPMSLCSMSKQITAQAILQLEEKGLLSIEDKVGKYIDWMPNYAKNIKISHLIYHSSGISDYMNDNVDIKKMTLDEMQKENLIIDEKYIKNYIINTKPKFKAGKEWSYSNSGYYLLARIVEKVSGQSFGDYIKQNIFAKIGANNSYININDTKNIESQPHKTWPLYTKIDNVFATLFANSDGDGGIFMSIDDYEKYIKEAFLGGKIFAKTKTYQKFMSPGFDMEEGAKYGFGLVHNSTGKYKVIAHDGGHDGYNSTMHYYPEKDLIIAMFYGTNTVAVDRLPENIVRCFE